MNLCEKPIHELRNLIRDKSISPVELAGQYLHQADSDSGTHPVFATMSSAALEILARKAERVESSDACGKLHGIPLAVDDLIESANLRTTFGSRAYEQYVPEVDAMALRRLKAAGAIVQGKTATAEFGIISEESSRFVNSPFGDGLTAGGGSVGAAVAVASGFTAGSVCIDVGGNVLLPAAMSGVFAFRPTHGTVPVTPADYGGMSMQDVAVVTRDAHDAALLMSVLAGFSAIDAHSLDAEPPDFLASIGRAVRPLRIAYVSALWNAPMNEVQKEALSNVVATFKSLQCRIERQRPSVRSPIEAWETVTATNLYENRGAALKSKVDLLGEDVQNLLEAGRSTSASEYIQAQREILGFRAVLRIFFDNFDILITPTAGCLPYAHGSSPTGFAEKPLPLLWKDYASACVIGAVSGFPLAQMPVAQNAGGIPSGLAVMGRPRCDDIVLSLCAAYERAARSQSG